MNALTPFLMLLSRFFLFAFFQASIAFLFFLSGTADPWRQSEGYWVISGLLANIATFLLLLRLTKKDGVHYLRQFQFTGKGWWKDLLITLSLLIIAAPLTTIPNNFLAEKLLGSSEISYAMFFRKIPFWAVMAGFLWPVTQGLVELPLYFSYCMPKIEKRTGNGWIAWALASFFLAFQHAALPLIFNLNFTLWRFGMFFLFAFFIGLCLKLRPRLFPYLMIAHALLDLPLVIMLLYVK